MLKKWPISHDEPPARNGQDTVNEALMEQSITNGPEDIDKKCISLPKLNRGDFSLFVALFVFLLAQAPMPVALAAADTLKPALEKLLLVWSQDQALYFDLELRTTSDGLPLESAKIALSEHARVFEYTSPHRFKGDLLILDGIRIHLEAEHGQEAMRPTVYRDLMNRRIFWIASQLFGDFWPGYAVKEQASTEPGKREFLLSEQNPLAPVELLKIIYDDRTGLPSTGRLFDHERDEVWDLTFSFENSVALNGQDHVFLSQVRIRTAKNEVYFLRLKDMRTGALDHMLRGLAVSHE